MSGGERSFTSIALVFAVTQVNPPPFLVLDETDAALDEANSKRYSDMIEMLSKYSQLITVTHNRETMSRADVIYGVTIGSDGGSKLLSIRFDEAENYISKSKKPARRRGFFPINYLNILGLLDLFLFYFCCDFLPRNLQCHGSKMYPVFLPSG